MDKTINYYNHNAWAFYDRTINTDLSDIYKRFLKYLPVSSHILDAGCGVGRDTKYFLEHGYEVTAFDASEKMADLAEKETKTPIIRCSFKDMKFVHEFEGVWAQASLLHVPYQETKGVYEKIYRGLKSEGIFYASYKYGQDHMPTSERDFWNMDEEKVNSYLADLFELKEMWQEVDTRSKVSPSKEGKWLHFIAKKIGS